MATKTAQTKKSTVPENRWDKVKSTAKNVNKFILESAEDLVDGALKNGEQWQGVAAKATHGGLELTAKQTDIVFSTLETVKRQLIKNAPRFRKLFSFSK